MQKERPRGKFGFLTYPGDGVLGGYGDLTFKEKAVYAERIGVEYVNVRLTHENARAIRQGGLVEATRLSGTELEEVRFPASELKVVHDYVGPKLNTGEVYQKTIAALIATGKRFINGPAAIDICDDKQRSQELFDEMGVQTPKTADYTRANVRRLLAQSGFIFIKEVTGNMGRNQFTVSAAANGFVVKVDGAKEGFSSVDGALGFIEERMEGTYIVQEGIRVQKVDGSVFDIRAMFQMDGSGQLAMPAAFVRVGAKGLDQSNVSRGGQVQDPYVFYHNFEHLRNEIELQGRAIFTAMQRRTRDVADIGMDFLVSQEGRVIVLEINARPGTDMNIRDMAEGRGINLKLSLRAGDHGVTEAEVAERSKDMLTKAIQNPVDYAKHLIEQE